MPLGTPLTHARITIDARPGEASGEIVIGGAGVGGYHGRPEEEALRFRTDALGPLGARLYRTGDLGRLTEDGLLLFLGRLDDEVKIRGHRVAPGFVAGRLREYPGVRDCVVLAGVQAHGAPSLCAHVVLADGADLVGLRVWAAATLPAAMVPDRFLAVAALPLTANGKVDRDRLHAAAPDPARPVGQAARLLALWREVLAEPEAGPDDDFFALGGDSIMAIRLAGRARAAGLRFSAQSLFEHPTVNRLLAEGIAADQPAEAPPPITVAGPIPLSVPLSPVQRDFFALGLPKPNHWCMSAVLRLGGRPPVDAVGRALRAVAGRHAAFGLRFRPNKRGDMVQTCAQNAAIADPARLDQLGLDPFARRVQEDAATVKAMAHLDIAQGPLLASVLLDRGAGTASALLVVVHHLVFDAISWRVLAEELTAHLAGAPLPAAGIGFDLWCRALARHATRAAPQAPFWRRTEAAIVPILPRRGDRPDGNLEGLVRQHRLRLSAEDTAGLKRAAAEAGAGLHDVVLAALAAALQPAGGAVVIDVEGHGRVPIEADLATEQAIGWFTTHAPLALDLHPGVAPRRQLEAVHEAWRDLPESGLGYGVLRAMAATEGLGRDPEVSFNFLGALDSDAASPFERFGAAGERDPVAPRRHLLVVEAFTSAGALTVELLYPQELVDGAAIAAIADRMSAWCECLLQPQPQPRGAAGLMLDKDDLQALSERLGL